jgi:KaiC/GvpD/RAD55 family RecA-like ATPase
LNIALAGTGVGKSLFMCHVAAGCLSQGHNVLYITMEMAEEKIAERIDANLLNIDLDELRTITKEDLKYLLLTDDYDEAMLHIATYINQNFKVKPRKRIWWLFEKR